MLVDGGWCRTARGSLSEEDHAKGIILIAPDFLSSPLCDPGVRFLVHPLSPFPLLSLSLFPCLRFFLILLVASTASSFPRAGSSKSFLRLIFPSNLHAAVIKGLGRGTSSGASTDARAGCGASERGLVLVLAVQTPSKQWRKYLECRVRVPEAGIREISPNKTSAVLLSIFSSLFLLRD